MRKRTIVATFLAVSGLFVGYSGIAGASSEQPGQQEVPSNIVQPPAPEQPVRFSHKKHAESLEMPCEDCHTNADPGVMMGMPSVNDCLMCHKSIAVDKAPIIQLNEIANLGKEIEWVRVYKMKERAEWSHRVHMQAGAQCVTCHGDVTASDQLAQTTAVTAMASCIGCHESHSADITCITCHAWPPEPEHFREWKGPDD